MVPTTLHKAQELGIIPWDNPVFETKDFIVFLDKYPVTEDHTLIVPKNNNDTDLLKCFQYAISFGVINVDSTDNNITGYNIGINQGESAGQTVMYPHVHLIFRRDGDMEDPKGGVRGVIPEKQKY